MQPEFYANEYRRFAAVMHNLAPDVELFACGTDGKKYFWTHGMISILATSEKHVDGFAMHYYCGYAGYL